MPTPTRRLGNSRGFLISKPLRVEPEIPVEENALLVRASRHPPRGDRAKASRKIADSDRNQAIWPEFSNEGDPDLKWYFDAQHSNCADKTAHPYVE